MEVKVRGNDVYVNGKLHSWHATNARAWREADRLESEPVNSSEDRHDWSSSHNDK